MNKNIALGKMLMEISLLKSSKQGSAQLIADVTLELRNLAKHANMVTLISLLEITYYEAYHCANPVELPEAEFRQIQLLNKIGKEANEALDKTRSRKLNRLVIAGGLLA
jgi:hypothetical protein